MTLTTRSRVLDAIRNALAAGSETCADAAPDLAGQFQPQNVSAEDLLSSFSAELRALGGSINVVADEAACAAALSTYFAEHKIRSVALHSAPLAQAIGSRLRGFELIRSRGATASDVERSGCGLLEAEALLADTGSAIVISNEYQDRLLPYLPHTCAIVSRIERLHPSLSTDALAHIDDEARSCARGEAVIITGPSRTADIEKQLVLGAHGPANLVIFLIAEI